MSDEGSSGIETPPASFASLSPADAPIDQLAVGRWLDQCPEWVNFANRVMKLSTSTMRRRPRAGPGSRKKKMPIAGTGEIMVLPLVCAAKTRAVTGVLEPLQRMPSATWAGRAWQVDSTTTSPVDAE
jgi:hypothetical protein